MPLEAMPDRIRKLVSEIARFRPAFPNEIEGCSPAEVEALQSMLGMRLPAPYVEFLRCMGRSTGGLAPFEADYRASTLLRFYGADPREPDGPLAVGVARWGPFYEGEEVQDYPIDLKYEDEQCPRLVPFVPWEKGALFPSCMSVLDDADPTLYEAFFADAVLKFHLANFSDTRMLLGSARAPKSIEQTDAVLGSLGFSRHPESDCIGYYIHPEALVLVNNAPPTMRLTIATRSRAQLQRLADSLSKQLSLESSSIPGRV